MGERTGTTDEQSGGLEVGRDGDSERRMLQSWGRMYSDSKAIF